MRRRRARRLRAGDERQPRSFFSEFFNALPTAMKRVLGAPGPPSHDLMGLAAPVILVHGRRNT